MADLSGFDLNWGQIESNNMKALEKKKDVVEGKIKAAEASGVTLKKSLLDQLKPINDQIKKLQLMINIGDAGEKMIKENEKAEKDFKEQLKIEQT